MRLISITFVNRVTISTSAYIRRPTFYSLCYNHKRTYHSTPALFDKEETTPPPKEEKEKTDDTSQPEASKVPSRVRRPKYKLWLINDGKKFTNFYDGPNYLGANIVSYQ
jgi:hypothetical protein